MRGEEVKIHKKYDLERLHTGIRNVILIVKFSNDVSFSVIIQTQKIYKVWDRRLFACVGYLPFVQQG